MSDSAGMSSAQASDLMKASMATSAVTPVVGAIENIGAVKAQGSYQQSLSNANAALAKLKSAQTIEAGDIAASRRMQEAKGEAGAQRAAAGASGVDVNKGSPAMVRSDITTAGTIDELTIKNNAARVAFGYQNEALQDTFQGQFEKLGTQNKVQQSIATGGLSAISEPLSIYGNYLRWSRYMGGGGGGSGIVMPWNAAPSAPAANDVNADTDFAVNFG